MTPRLAIVVALCLCGVFCRAAISRLDAEDAVRRRLVQRDMRLGFDAEKGSYMVIASAAKSGSELGSSATCAPRVACYRLAELRAIHQILNMRKQTMAGETSVHRDPVGDATVKTVRTFVETFSQSDMDGCLAVDACELNEGEKCVVAVAMTWSADLERRARASADGTLQPAADWGGELKNYLDRWDGGLLPPALAFVDSAGFFHQLGVGAASLAGESTLERNAAACLADLWARKNLQLALYGRAAMRKKAELMMSRGRLAETDPLSSAYEALGEVSAEGPLPAGSRSIYDKVVQTKDGAKSVLIVYGIVPPPKAGGVLPTMGKTADGIQIWNPRTGKFEKQ